VQLQPAAARMAVAYLDANDTLLRTLPAPTSASTPPTALVVHFIPGFCTAYYILRIQFVGACVCSRLALNLNPKTAHASVLQTGNSSQLYLA
jgi:hypothetical protein